MSGRVRRGPSETLVNPSLLCAVHKLDCGPGVHSSISPTGSSRGWRRVFVLFPGLGRGPSKGAASVVVNRAPIPGLCPSDAPVPAPLCRECLGESGKAWFLFESPWPSCRTAWSPGLMNSVKSLGMRGLAQKRREGRSPEPKFGTSRDALKEGPKGDLWC